MIFQGKVREIVTEMPMNVSVMRISWIFSKIDDHIETNVVPLALIPKISLTCDDKMINDTALVKPDDTGPDTKFNRNPRPMKPIKISMIPVNSDKSTAFCQTPPAAWYVSNDAIAVGPIGTSLQEPRKIYTKQPMNEPYNPY